MYLDEILNDTFFLLLLIIISGLFVYVGWRNYRNPASRSPASPLGRYLLWKAVKQPGITDDEIRQAEVRERIVRVDATFAFATGLTILLVMGMILIIWHLSPHGSVI